MISLKRFATILQEQFDSFYTGFPSDFFDIKHIPAKGRQSEILEIQLGRRNIAINRRGSVIGGGTSFSPNYQVVKARRRTLRKKK